VFGYSSGEVTALFAGGFWSDPDRYLEESLVSGIFTREIAEPWRAVARAWGEDQVRWETWVVQAPVEKTLAALEGKTRAHLAVIHHDHEGILAGDPQACARVRGRLQGARWLRLDYDFAAHVPELAGIRDPWLELHRRPVQPRPGLRMYSAALASAYEPGTEACARNLLAQFDARLDFRKVVERAYGEGVRIFVEHGPQGSCGRWIRAILGGRDAVVVSFDRKGAGAELLLEAAAALWTAGAGCTPARLRDALHGRWPDPEPAPWSSSLAESVRAHSRQLTDQHLRFLGLRTRGIDTLMALGAAGKAEAGPVRGPAFGREQVAAFAAGLGVPGTT